MSPFRYFLVTFLSLLCIGASEPLKAPLNDDVLGLIVMKADLEDPDGALSTWNEDDDSPCAWAGVKCGRRSNRVTDLGLDGLNLSGHIGRGVLQLQYLRKLSLSGNNLTGELPRGLAALANLRLVNLSRNALSGSLASPLGSCVGIASLDLSHNRFSGGFPAAVWEMTWLKYLDFSDNLMDGEIPGGIERMRNLRSVRLSGNRFVGNVPVGIARCRLLRTVDFSRNAFSGGVPPGIQRLRFCGVLNLSNNVLVGDLPSFAQMARLQSIDLSANEFTGKLPGLPASVGDVNFSVNKLAGDIPVAFVDLSSMRSLDLSVNYITGEIPANVGNCTSLETLVLGKNMLTGPVPESMGELTRLRYVDLSYNNLTGTLPKDLASLSSLSTFNVSHNNLEGDLPASSFFNTISPSSISDNPLLCKSCPAVLPKPIVLNPNSSTTGATDNVSHKKIILSISALIAIGAAALILAGVIGISVLNLRVRKVPPQEPSGSVTGSEEFSQRSGDSGKLVMFSGEPRFGDGAHALLRKDCEIGRGGFGSVYRTVLRDGTEVAIKKLAASSLVKNQEDFEREVRKLGKVRDSNLVAMKGYYWTPSLQLLIYEYVAGGSLYNRLHYEKEQFRWSERFRVLLGVARGLARLHKLGIVHYNIKSSNVLMTAEGEAKLGDFGLARLLPKLDRYVLSSKIQSALGYTAPEFECRTVKISEKCDVYGLGALILEVVTGRMPVEYMEDDVVMLRDVVREALERERVEECLDGGFPVEEVVPVVKLGLICTSQVPSTRPDMAEVVRILEMIRCPIRESNSP